MKDITYKLTEERILDEFDEFMQLLYKLEGVKLFPVDGALNRAKANYIHKVIYNYLTKVNSRIEKEKGNYTLEGDIEIPQRELHNFRKISLEKDIIKTTIGKGYCGHCSNINNADCADLNGIYCEECMNDINCDGFYEEDGENN